MPQINSDNKYASHYKEINYDYSGNRSLRNKNEENVSFRNNTSIRIWYNDLPDGYDAHQHGAIEIIMPIDNYYDVTINEKDFHLVPSDILIIPPREMHSIKAPKSGKRFIFLIDISHLTGLKGFSGIRTLLYTPILMTRETYPAIYEDVYDLLVKMRNEYFSENEYAELTIYALLIDMFVKFGYNHINTEELFPNVRLYKQKEYAKKFNELLDYIDNHYMDELTLETISDTIGFSKFHFSRLFKQYTNFTFCDYLNLRRIKAAESLLIEPDLSITEIALQTGFMSISTFNRIFKQHEKCTPSEYRSKNSKHGHHL